MRTSIIGLTAAMLIGGCGVAPTEAPATTTAGAVVAPMTTAVTVTIPVAAEFPVRSCGGAVPRDWTLLCQAAELIAAHHASEPDPVGLAAAALLGVESARFDPVTPPEVLGACTVPDAAFEVLCAPILEGAALGKGTVEERVEAAVQGLFRYGLDPFSSYIQPDFADRLDELGGGVIPTLGMAAAARFERGESCGPITTECRLRVTAVFPFGTADRGGLVAGDVIVAIDGVAVLGLSPDEAIALLYGPPGSAVELEVSRDGGLVQKSLVHEDIRFSPIEFEVLPASIVYIRLNEFSQASAQLLGRALDTTEARSSRGLILDLRANPGGLLLAAQAVASQFLETGTVLVEESRSERHEWPVIEGGLAPDTPLVVLTSRDSASASEVVAAALQEAGRATVIGDRTFGKNAVQLVFRARNGGEFRITTSRWTTGEGLDVGSAGLTPDILIEERATGDDDPALLRAFGLLGG